MSCLLPCFSIHRMKKMAVFFLLCETGIPPYLVDGAKNNFTYSKIRSKLWKKESFALAKVLAKYFYVRFLLFLIPDSQRHFCQRIFLWKKWFIAWTYSANWSVCFPLKHISRTFFIFPCHVWCRKSNLLAGMPGMPRSASLLWAEARLTGAQWCTQQQGTALVVVSQTNTT